MLWSKLREGSFDHASVVKDLTMSDLATFHLIVFLQNVFEGVTGVVTQPMKGRQLKLHALLKMSRYYNTTMRHYWDMLVK